MKFLANENVPKIAIHQLRQKGLDVKSVSEEKAGASDTEVILKENLPQWDDLKYGNDPYQKPDPLLLIAFLYLKINTKI